LVSGWNRLGAQTQFYGQTIRGVWDAFVHYKVELVRLTAQMSLGTGALAVIGGTVVIVGFLTLSAGSLIAVQAYTQLQEIGVDALAWSRRWSPGSAWPRPSARARPRSWAPCGSAKRSTPSR
jgi:phospholipid/cholesterol/gamma-HCH transport system permease protein